MRNLTYPFDEKTVRSLKAGDAVSITGRIYTGRDKFHKFFADGGNVTVDFRDGALYHCGPVVVKDGEGWRVMAAGPTTSVREIPTSRSSSPRAAFASSSARVGWTRRRLRR
jgi:fumarate hydratase class I